MTVVHGWTAEPSIALKPELPALLCFTNLTTWARAEGDTNTVTVLSPWIRSGDTTWNQAVLSWNVEPATNGSLLAEVQLLSTDSSAETPGPCYDLGRWSMDEGTVRTSRRGQKDELAEVQTDTLVLRRPAAGFRVSVTLSGALAREPGRVRLLTVALADTRSRPAPREPLKSVWGRTLEVPERSQIAYEGGEGWCSPTSVSMVMAWWAKERGRPEWDIAVPEVARGVNDPGWPGTGNWSFNVAYAGSRPGLRAMAVRLRDVRALEELIAVGVPVVMSIHPPSLRGGEMVPGSGHLIVCAGFTESGDMVANDPWARLEKGQRVRRVYARANVERSWAHAHRLAYVILPEDLLGQVRRSED